MGQEKNKGWESLKLNPQLYRAIEAVGWANPMEIQKKVVPLVLGGQAVIGIAQTGTGKTAAYLLPLLMRIKYAQGKEPRALILAPTKELVVQIADEAKRLSQFTDIRTLALYGGIGPSAQVTVLKNGVDLIIATPGRFMELYLKKEIQVKQLKILVLDEADRMMEMGFLAQLRNIFEVIPQRRQNLLFSATFPARTERLSAEFLEFPVKVEITPQATPAEAVSQELFPVPNFLTKLRLLEKLLSDRKEFSRVLIFTRSKKSANNIFKFLEHRELGPVRVIHSNKGQNSRINAMHLFKSGELRVLVSTDVSSRGIDVDEVSHVINFEVPVRYEDYIHRIGRTGRVFRTGKAISFVNEAEQFLIRKIEEQMGEKIRRLTFPADLAVAEALPGEEKQLAKEIDHQRRMEDPEFGGAFHRKNLKI